MSQSGLDIVIESDPLGFQFGPGVFGPNPEIRSIDAIRGSLRDPLCDGPNSVYAIAMDVGRNEDIGALERHGLVFGLVTFASGRLGIEPIRSQGHVHAVSAESGWRPPEVYEVWTGRGIIYAQESAGDDPGRCFAVLANPGDIVIVPPGWAHAAISASTVENFTFAAWCDRNHAGFEYTEVRKHGGLAWFPILMKDDRISWEKNHSYPHSEHSRLVEKSPRVYSELGVQPRVPIYCQFRDDPSRFDFVPMPNLVSAAWANFVP